MNTVFKTYAQVWVLWGVGGGAALATYVADANTSVRSRIPGASRRGVRVAFAVLLVASTAVYAAQALPAHAAAGRAEPTLDATAFVAERHPQEAPAIRALDGVEGTPTMVSAPATSRYPGPGGAYPAPPGMYGWNSSPAASLTGVPTVAGWHHEVGYRGPGPYLARVRDVDAIYTNGTGRRRALMEEYDVRYVWVGPAERARYGREAFGFGRMRGVEVWRRTTSVTIYRVERSGVDVRVPAGS
jgi:uncharacterized membrane protein